MATKSALTEATTLTDDWSRLVIPLTRDMDARDSDWEAKMPKKVYAALANLWVERRAFLERLRVELKAAKK